MEVCIGVKRIEKPFEIVSPPVADCNSIMVRKAIDTADHDVIISVFMKALIQRVSSAQVDVDGHVVGKIGRGLLVFLCAVRDDADEDLDYIVKKVSRLRIFGDAQGKMNLSVLDIKGEALVVSQFTLAAATRKGNRPSFDEAEAPDRAKEMYEAFIERLKGTGIGVQAGVFAAMMNVALVNDGPVTIWLDSRE